MISWVDISLWITKWFGVVLGNVHRFIQVGSAVSAFPCHLWIVTLISPLKLLFPVCSGTGGLSLTLQNLLATAQIFYPLSGLSLPHLFIELSCLIHLFHQFRRHSKGHSNHPHSCYFRPPPYLCFLSWFW